MIEFSVYVNSAYHKNLVVESVASTIPRIGEGFYIMAEVYEVTDVRWFVGKRYKDGTIPTPSAEIIVKKTNRWR